MDLWNQWATQILVILSLMLQVVLHIFAGIRRREAMPVERFILWLAYQLADSTAIYAIGNLSLSSAAREHNLVAFWAPFLLVHLGGPDNITAYSLEDNKLWKRHLVTLVVQVLGVGYVLYKNITGNGTMIVVAAILMSIIGTAKYGERTYALWWSNFSTIRNYLKLVQRNKHQHFYIEYEHPRHLGDNHGFDDELLLHRAHSLFYVCKRGIVDSVIINDDDDSDNRGSEVIRDLMKDKDHKSMWTVMEMELSLMYDILYTKAYVIHTSLGYIIRIMAPITIVASLLLFLFSGKGGHNRIDVIITYVLLGGALVLETRSLLRSLWSTWALVFLCDTRWSWLRHVALCNGRWHRLRYAVLSLRRPIKTIFSRNSRRWSGRIGQYNVLHSCYHKITEATTSHCWFEAFDDLSTLVGFTDWLDMKHCSSNLKIPDKVKTTLQDMHTRFAPDDLNTMGLLRYNWGMLAMGESTRPEQFEDLKKFHGVDFHESILIWHIATDLFLAKTGKEGPTVEAIRAMSNYMMYLFVDCPEMLPGLPQNWLYEMTKKNIIESCRASNGFTHEVKHGGQRSLRLKETEQVAGKLLKIHIGEVKPGPKEPRLTYARIVADTLSEWKDEDPIDVLFDLWIDFLMYAANRCNRESHAKKLNAGGEFLTIVWLMIEHFQQLAKAKKERGNE
ncbi:hypothetical protein OsI_14750 [Oryza sativa Indica Group]|uniref:DUF4220 domain-containing protein n=1 Tax=Oryza sativa subsp. indica TaxID=39946 RepID=A2XQ46_ORYSI|nr:hypothetical protein OsI_14750 [Oryza sativa Indica Group]